MNNLFTGNYWTDKQRKAAHKEGWDIFDIDSRSVLEVQRLDEADKFPTDTEARAHVSKRAQEGSVLHLQALATIASAIIIPICGDCVEDPDDCVKNITDAENMIDSGDRIKWGIEPRAAATLMRTIY